MIITERLSIRLIAISDWKAIQSIWVNQAKSIYASYIKPKVLDDQSVYGEIAKWAGFTVNDKHHYLAICCGSIVIGYVALHQTEDGYEIGYAFHPDYHGKGYAKESISAILNYIKRQGVTQITAQTALKNIPSINLLLSLGFKQTRTVKVSFCQDAEGNEIVFDDGIFVL